eukprot:5046352-Prymnesium_polylepis.2
MIFSPSHARGLIAVPSRWSPSITVPAPRKSLRRITRVRTTAEVVARMWRMGARARRLIPGLCMCTRPTHFAVTPVVDESLGSD